MKIIKFRIQNYKSIVDSGVCSMASDLTVIIGKNESGKTATLEALRDFDKNVSKISDDAYPLDGINQEPLIEICFQVSENELDKIQKDAGILLAKDKIDHILNNGLTVIKDGGGKYTLEDEQLERLFSNRVEGKTSLQIGLIKDAKHKLLDIFQGRFFPDFNLDAKEEDLDQSAKEFIKSAKKYVQSLKDDEKKQNDAIEAMRVIIKECSPLKEVPRDSKIFFVDAVIQNLPSFIFFNEFSGNLPFEVPLALLKENQAVLDFAKITNLDLDSVKETTDIQRRINLLNRHSAKISGDFLNYWGQNRVELVAKTEGDKLLFGVKDHETTDFFKIGQRSRGFQWFLSFYLRLNAQKGDNNIIIIDEPGMNLHATAQVEIIKVLEERISPHSQVIFSTHCPYLVDTNRMDRIRLIIKSSETGTLIKDDVHKVADEESILPLMGTKTIEKSTSLPSLGKRNVILDGTSDFYYLKSMKKFIDNYNLEGINFLPSSNHDNVEQLVSLMLGNGLDFQVLLNHDDGSRNLSDRLKEKFGLNDEKVNFLTDESNLLMEDLFTRDDFIRQVLDGKINDGEGLSNSEYLKSNKINRIILAKEFSEKIQDNNTKIDFSEATLTAFREVFKIILIGFNELFVPSNKKEESQEKLPVPAKRKSLFKLLRK